MSYTEIEESPSHHDVPSPDVSQSSIPPARPITKVAAVLMRLIIPAAILGVGIAAFMRLSVEPPKEQAPPAEKQAIRARLAELKVEDYQVVIKTNGLVQAHNQVALSAEVSGRVISISESFEAGAYFARNELLVELDPRDYETAVAVAEANLLGAEAALELAQETYERNEGLAAKNGVSLAVLKQSFAEQAQASATLDTAKAQLAQAKRDLDRTRILAPFDGRVLSKNVGLGQSVGPGAPLGNIFAVDYAEVRLPIAGKELQYLRLPELSTDQPVPVQLTDAINPESTAVWDANIVRTEGTLDVDSLELFAIARIDDPFGLETGQEPLRVGQPVIASIAGSTLKDVVKVPRVAVRQLDQVYLVNRNEDDELVLQGKTLEPVWTDEDYLIVRDPEIKDGQLLATTRIVYAPDGAKVEEIPDIADGVDLTDSTESKDGTATASKGS